MKIASSWRISDDLASSPRGLVLTFLVAAGVAALLCVSAAGPASADDDDDDGGEFVPRQIVVKVRPAVSIGYINTKYGTTTLQRFPGTEKIYLLRTPRGTSPVTLANRIEANEPRRVIYAEPNFRAGSPEGSRSHRGFPGGIPDSSTDPARYRAQYAADNLNLPEAHGVSRGAGVVVAVIDTGVQLDHEELADRLTTARYDFVDEDQAPWDLGNSIDDDRDGASDEMVGHGTHVAGIVALAAPEARIMAVRALDSEGRGTTFGIAKAIRFSVSNGADVVNLSLGSSQESDLLEDLIGDDDDDAMGKTVFVAAAGNDGNTASQYPAAEDGAVAVTSVDQAKKKSDFANFGGWVTVAAPGSDIHSPFPTGRYAMWSGTSMATPFVAGQAALIKSLKPDAPAGCVTEIIGATAESLAVSDPTYARRLGGHADVGASTAYARSNVCPAGDD
ncbi:MAG: S8 family serine peptidase [Actinomycetota bacterium]|nr:S8 family serine peptidase [Actinomycetota bacterium]